MSAEPDCSLGEWPERTPDAIWDGGAFLDGPGRRIPGVGMRLSRVSSLIVGMCNPQERAPLDASIPGSAGSLLWGMFRARLPEMTMQRYDMYIARTNACTGREWRPAEASEFCRKLRNIVPPDYSIMCLGREIADMMGASDEPLLWTQPHCWVSYFPHPSGLNRWFNDPVQRAAAEVFLEEYWYDRVLARGYPATV